MNNDIHLLRVSKPLFDGLLLKADRHGATLPRNFGVQPLYVMVRHCVICVAGLHAIVARQICSVSVRLYKVLKIGK